MEYVSPLVLYSAAMEIHQIHSIINRIRLDDPEAPIDTLVTNEDCHKILRLMNDLAVELEKLNCPVSAKSAKKPARLMEDGRFTYAMIIQITEEIDGRIRDELRAASTFSLSGSEAAYFDPDEPLFGFDVSFRFEKAEFDIDEAGKCLALGRSTSAVFHVFRVLEVGIYALAKCMRVPDLDKPVMKNWGNVLSAIERGIISHFPKDADRDMGIGAHFWDVYQQMLALRVPRNGTMHPARKYTEQEALRMFNIVRGIMETLAEHINENGEPKRPVKRSTKHLPKKAT